MSPAVFQGFYFYDYYRSFNCNFDTRETSKDFITSSAWAFNSRN